MHHNDNKVNVCIQLLSIHEARLKKKEQKCNNFTMFN